MRKKISGNTSQGVLIKKDVESLDGGSNWKEKAMGLGKDLGWIGCEMG